MKVSYPSVRLSACADAQVLALRVEWAKSYARTARWSEEVLLTIEEMRRVSEYLRWKANWWLTLECRTDVSAELRQGWMAYARRQAATLTTMRARFAAEWRPALNGHHMALASL